MKKFIIFIGIFLFSKTIDYKLHIDHAFALDKDKKILVLEYQKVNDTIDILNIKESELKNTSFNAIGDMDGYKLSFLYGYTLKTTLFTSLNKQKIEYGDGNLNNYQFNLLAKYNIFSNSKRAIGVDFGIKMNKAENMEYSNPSYLKSLAKRFLNVKDVGIDGNRIGIIKDDGSTKILNLKSPPSISIKNLKDYTINTALNIEKAINYKFLLNFSLKLNYSKIYTQVVANIIPADEDTEEKLKKYDLMQNLGRDEFFTDIGFNVSYKSFITTEFSYYYRRFFRDSNLGYVNYNHIINLDFTKEINDNIALFIGGKLMYRQFNGEIPYLYNKYSQTTFDHKYGFARAGIIYNF